MSDINDEELFKLRLTIAVSICVKFPKLYLWSNGKVKLNASFEELTAACILKKLRIVEPRIDKILELYL